MHAIKMIKTKNGSGPIRVPGAFYMCFVLFNPYGDGHGLKLA